MPSKKALFVDADAFHLLHIATSETSIYRPFHDRMGGVPVQSQQLNRATYTAARLRDIDGESLKHQCKARVLTSPRNLDRFIAALVTS